MSRTWSVRAVAMAAVLAAGSAGIAGAHQASAATTSADHGRPPGDTAVPSIIRPPTGATFLAAFHVVTGAQVYQCTAGTWTFKAPEATLVGRAGHRIHHFAGPTWQSLSDGSMVTATKAAESPVPGSIPQLLLKVTGHGAGSTGELSTATYIQRLHTKGGTAPTGACAEGATDAVRYSADYVFFANG